MTGATQLHSLLKYIYLAGFFALLSGLFHPLVAGSGLGVVIFGVLVLFGGLYGVILLYKAATLERRPSVFVNLQDNLLSYKEGSDNRRGVFLAVGFVLVVTSMFFIYQLTGRV